MDAAKIAEARAALAAKMGAATKIGGSRKVVKKTTTAATSEDKQIATTVKKLGCQNIGGCGEATFFHNDSTVTRIMHPNVLANPGASTFVISGKDVVKKNLMEVLGEVYPYMGLENLSALSQLAGTAGAGEDEDDVPELVENFEETSKQ